VRYILDTNAVSALMKGDGPVLARLEAVSKSDVFVPQPVLAELAYGIERRPRSKRREALQDRFELVRAELQRMEWTDEVSQRFGIIKAALEKKGQRIEDFASAIAAHATGPDAVLVTANLDDMVRVPGLIIEDWSRPLSRR
jgi:tRNA(fMet)-specific endonuclease VapC